MRPTAYRRNARGLRDRQAVRLQAGALLADGHTQAQVARQLGVARQNVSRWHAQWQAGGLPALRSAGPTGPTRAFQTSNCTPSTRRCARMPAPTASTPTTGPSTAWPP